MNGFNGLAAMSKPNADPIRRNLGTGARIAGVAAALSPGLLLVACVPTFSDLQSARLAGVGRVEITPSASVVEYSQEEDSWGAEGVQGHLGVQLATGLSDRIDLRLRYEFIDEEWENWGNSVHVVAVGAKFGLIADRAAFYLPVGTGIGEGVEPGDLVQFQPTLLFTYPFNSKIEVTGSGKGIIWVDRDMDDLLAFNLGAGVSKDLTRWAIRPEAGILIDPGEDRRAWHWSVGFTYYAGRSR